MLRLPPLALLALAALLAACSNTWTSEGTWVAGDPHVHSVVGSNDAAANSTVESLATVARSQALDWLVITDHSNSAGSMGCPDVEDCPNQGPEFPAGPAAALESTSDLVLAVGSELSPIETLEEVGGPLGHVGCLPPTGSFEFDGAFVDRPPGAVSGGEVLDQCQEVGGLAVLNHPFAPTAWIRWDWSSQDHDAIEVWNGGLGWDDSDQRALWSWECSIAQGRSVVPLAASDVHDADVAVGADPLSPALGSPRTSVLLAPDEALSWSAVRTGLERGIVILHEHDSFVSLRSMQTEGDEEHWRLGGTTPSRATLQIREVPLDDSCDPALQQAPLHQVVWEGEVDGDFEVEAASLSRLDNRASAGRYLFLERVEREPFSGGVVLSGVLPRPD